MGHYTLDPKEPIKPNLRTELPPMCSVRPKDLRKLQNIVRTKHKPGWDTTAKNVTQTCLWLGVGFAPQRSRLLHTVSSRELLSAFLLLQEILQLKFP